jgi:hypothetical protein
MVVENVQKRLAEVNRQRRSLRQKDLISGSQKSLRLGNSIRLRSQTGL